MAEGPRLEALDGLRFLAALGVLFWHYQHFWYQDGQLVGFVRESQPLYPWLSFLYDHTVHSVQVFWCLSGYIFFWKYERSIAEGSLGGRKFFVLRFSRLYPLHIVTFVLVVVLQAIHRALTQQDFVYQNNDLYHAVLQLFLASNWGFEAGLSFNGPIWSVSVEVLVYGLFFVVTRRFGANLGVHLLIIGVAAVGYLVKLPSAVFQGVVCFYMGGLAVTLGRVSWVDAHRLLVRNLCIAVLIAVPLLGLALQLFHEKVFVHLFVVAYTPVLLYWLANHYQLPQVLKPAFALAGNVTFASYLIHFPIQLLLAIGFAWAGQPLPRESIGIFVAFFGCSLVASAFVYKYFELPAQQWVRKFSS